VARKSQSDGATLLLSPNRIVRVSGVNPNKTHVTRWRSQSDLLARRGTAFVIVPEQHHTSTLLGELARRLKPDTGRAPRPATLQSATSEDCTGSRRLVEDRGERGPVEPVEGHIVLGRLQIPPSTAGVRRSSVDADAGAGDIARRRRQ
jgi:hypothetical protein